MGRPRSFDEAETLEKVLEVFWKHGFDGASYPAMETATGLHRQSLRYAFGDKEALFCRVIDRYSARKVTEILHALDHADSPLSGVAAALDVWRRDAEHPDGWGCMIVNAMAELGSHPGPAMTAARRTTKTLQAAFSASFRAAQAAGEVRGDLDAEILAAQAVALGDGLILNGRGGGVTCAADVFAAFLKQLRP